MKPYMMDFDKWWVSGGQGIAERKYLKELEGKFKEQKFVDEKVRQYYSEGNVGNRGAEGNAFWYAMEEMARKDMLHLK